MNNTKDKPPLNEKHLATWEHNHVYFDLLGYQLKKLLKKWKIRMLGGKMIIEK